MNEIIILISIYYFLSITLFSFISYKKTSNKIKTSNSTTLFNNDLNERLL